MHKTWSAVVGKRKNYAWLNALGITITSAHDAKTKAKHDKNKARRTRLNGAWIW